MDVKCGYGEDAPHQKVVVVDGVVGFEGAANFSVPAWEKAASRRDRVKILTSTAAMRTLDNEDFAPVWGDYSKVTTTHRSYCTNSPPPWDDWDPEPPPEDEEDAPVPVPTRLLDVPPTY